MPAVTTTDEAERPDQPLSELMNAATRSVHSQLNKLVVSRLRLALPPQAEDASNYVSGLLHITPIYIAFESLWQGILQSGSPGEDDGETKPSLPTVPAPCNLCCPEAVKSEQSDLQTLHEILDFATPAVAAAAATVAPQVRTVLTALRVPGLVRSAALHRDIVALTGWSLHTVAEHLDDAAESPVLAEFLHHIRHAVAGRPHVLVAYAWVLYMALFSGGRVIRAALERVDPDFWVPASASASASSRQRKAAGDARGPLRFFSFNTALDKDEVEDEDDADDNEEDGEADDQGDTTPADDQDRGDALKATFKSRLTEAETLLTAEQRDEIVEEAHNIFVFMVRLVAELDEVCDSEPAREAGAGMLALRSRDSVIVKKERRALARLAQRVSAEQQEKDGGRGQTGKWRGKWKDRIERVIPGRRPDA